VILQALKAYYDRKIADPQSGIAPEGWEWKEIPFVIVLDKNGSFLRFEDTREGEGNKKRGKLFLVPQGEKKASGIKANLLWDTPNYVFGVADRRADEQKKAFVERIKNDIPDSTKRVAVMSFLTSNNVEILEKIPEWEEIIKTKPNMAFRFDDELLLYCQSEEVKQALNEKSSKKQNDGRCLISGEQDKISVIHTSIKGVWGAQSSGANIVSFNCPAFESFGKEQSKNAPVGETAMFAYTTALNHLLQKGSLQRMQVGDASTVFWSEKRTKFEGVFSDIFAEPPKDNPDANTDAVKTLFASPKTGEYMQEDEGTTPFYVLGLSPNAARISVRFWKTGTVAEFSDNIRQHFTDLEITKPQWESEHYSLWRLLVNAAIQDKSENIPPNIAGDFMRSILDGTPYPATLLQLVLRRVKSDTKYRVKPVRAALIKAYLNRYERYNTSNDKELAMALDTEQTSEAYHLGRLFAVLEKIQEEAYPDINATIRERYYGAACGNPITVFPTLLRLKNHHIAKLENKGRGVNFEKRLGEIMSHFNDFPAHLDLHNQGKFAIGYYHQRQALFPKSETPDTAGNISDSASDSSTPTLF
jgi:CRISPR-associated protein Csd1